ncbi:MAG: transposase [Gammaproteobacteria bacterium AqS3]|nr:transposase [Gammaproteobacteria bacterium AqS3]
MKKLENPADVSDFSAKFSDEKSAAEYLALIRWKTGVDCPYCDSRNNASPVKSRTSGKYRCKFCRKDFSVRTETIFERSNIKLHKWLYAIYLLQTARQNLSSPQLGSEIGITQKSAWLMLRRIREACAAENIRLAGIAKKDEIHAEKKEKKNIASPVNKKLIREFDRTVRNILRYRMTYTPSQRIASYVEKTKFPECLHVGEDGRILGIWVMGNDYRVRSGYYGGYPAGYLKRIKALFPDKGRVLHLFSGRVDLSVMPGDTVDLDPEAEPTFLDDAQTLKNVPIENYDLILADPPYSVEDADHYQPTMVKRNKVMKTLGKRAKIGTHVVWLDQVLPMYRKDEWSITGLIGMVKSTNHRFRVVTIFERCKNSN